MNNQQIPNQHFSSQHSSSQHLPNIEPIGDEAIIIRFAKEFDENANIRSIGFSNYLAKFPIDGVKEIGASLVSVLIKYDKSKVGYFALIGQLRLALSRFGHIDYRITPKQYDINIEFGAEFGLDFEEVIKSLNMSAVDFIKQHNAKPLRVIATGFAPGFIYCGMHKKKLHLPRRTKVRDSVAAGSVIFAAGQTAISATSIPTGWHVIGRTDFCNFDVNKNPPNILQAGDMVHFMDVSNGQ